MTSGRCQVLLLCPQQNQTNAAAWAVAVLQFLYAQDLVLDGNDSGRGFPGTAAVSNFNTRILLEPRVHFARLRALTWLHHNATLDLLARYDLLMPVRALGHRHGSDIIAQSLGWSRVPKAPVRNQHAKGNELLLEAKVLDELGDTMREHNKRDVSAVVSTPVC